MSPIPNLPLKPDEIPETIDEDTILKLAQSFVILTNYTATQYQRCGVR